MNILLVEDDLALAHALGNSLRRQNYAVNTVHTGKTALAAIKQGDTDIVVLPKLLYLVPLLKWFPLGPRIQIRCLCSF